MRTTYTVTVDVEVYDIDELYAAAKQRAINDSGDPDDVLLDGEPDAGLCLQMLLDPGSLPGCSILQSNVDSIEGE